MRVRFAFGLVGVLLATPLLAADAIVSGNGAQIRVLDKLTGVVSDVTLASGENVQVGFLTINLSDCRYAENNLAGDAFAQFRIYERDTVLPVFAGWMLASAPALHALDHPRYDVWVMRCTTS
jgi:hypothetical protein